MLDPQELSITVPSVSIKTDSFVVQSISGEQVFIRGETDTEDEENDTLIKQLVTEDVLGWLFNHIHPGNGQPALGRPMNTEEIMTESPDPSAVAQQMQADAGDVNSDLINVLDAVENLLAPILGTGTEPLAPVIALLLAGLRVNLLKEQGSAVLISQGASTSPDDVADNLP